MQLFCNGFIRLLDSHITIQSPNVSTTPLRQWDFWQCSPFSLRGKCCQHPIAIMGVVDTFGLKEMSNNLKLK